MTTGSDNGGVKIINEALAIKSQLKDIYVYVEPFWTMVWPSGQGRGTRQRVIVRLLAEAFKEGPESCGEEGEEKGLGGGCGRKQKVGRKQSATVMAV